MAAIKFSKQNIQPNPLEVDYWVDITSNPYGGNIKYYNGYDWVDLLNSKGTPINLDAYYNKVLMNQMLAGKASVESVDSKVDDTEVADVIKNIEFKDRGDGGIEMIILKYNDTTVGVTMPIASNTTSGVITKESFKDFVKLNQLQQLYSVFYTTIASIRSQYQPRLSAGKNITIDRTTNTIHAIGKISTDWDDLTNVPDFDGMFGDINDAIQAETDRAKTEESKLSTRITDHVDVVRAELDLKADKKDMYTKDQVDEKVASVYKVKGSSTFEDLPTKGNIVGDVYNITNNFILNNIEYPFGTNLVWTENGWDTLSGVFDTTELEGFIDDVDNKVDEEIVRAKTAELNIQTQLDAEITRSTEADTTITQSISNAISTVKTYTDTKVSAETTRATNAEEALSTSLSTEISNREASDATLQSNIDIVDGKLINYLPLSGGTVTGVVKVIDSNVAPFIVNTNNTAVGILLMSNSGSGYLLYYGNNDYYVTDNGWNTRYKIYHEGNDGEGSGLDADMLDGVHVTNSIYKEGVMRSYRVGTFTTANQYFGNGVIVCFDSKPTDNDDLFENTALLSIGDGIHRYRQLAFGWKNYDIKYRYTHSSGGVVTFNNWKTIAFTDSDITGNAATATKLATPVKLWGNDFDGSSDINGQLNIWNNNPILWNDTDGHGVECLKLNNKNNLIIGSGIAGTVGIKTTDPQYTLDVNGITRTKSLILHNNNALNVMTAEGYNKAAMHLSPNNNLIIGYGTSAEGYDSTIMGNSIKFDYSSDQKTGMILNSSGNVTIGNADLAGTNKLYIDGNLKINGYTYAKGPVYTHGKSSSSDGVPGVALIKNNDSGWISISGATPVIGFHFGNSSISTSQLKEVSAGKLLFDCSLDITNTVGIGDDLYVTDKIAMGDYVDWYGVSWSENSSDPTCTRIGNMALHRSLPILSAMKGYMIQNTNARISEIPFPLNDDWTRVKYNTSDNDGYEPSSYGNGNIMVKIPEFWYIDDYEPSTKTHNLKISQTAKAGWLHHKEAYVSAYEGYNDGTYYRSTKNVIPTVSVSRTTLRPLARANGYEDEYKWNIYTYEEHRAICHLFLVEYATRNSQLAVNTALTADGFKQGGLGSGCTTGAVTINGQTTYSFIPTGTTDSLGNGSGQVAYTVTQTDADGNEIGTVTRYANRYRGIENPFGHIWKHVDDIVNVYNAETTYKTVYKCNKPEHFATNKNAKYKPLCSFPGGSKMQGWSKEIKATINCDFFKYSIGGSESTYWCDYNYDNDDTSKHCLLIGGCSGNGGWAGLFYFALGTGVGGSYVDIGSRLTYLPWAE